MSDRPKQQTIYHVYPLSFYAADDGRTTGDLRGITSKLDYLEWLGIDCIWTSPILQSPQVDNGYDVSDYRKIDSSFGTMEDLEELIAEAHKRGIKVLMDFVLNHCSDQHPWFQEAISNPKSPYRSYFYFRQSSDGPPNNQLAQFGDPNNKVSAWHEVPGEPGMYFLGTFQAAQPDLNWSNPKVQTEMLDVLRFWLEKGVDGVRLDVIHLIGKPANYGAENLPQDEVDSFVGKYNHPELAAAPLRAIRALFDEYRKDILVGEVNLDDAELQAPYQSGGKLTSTFIFRLLVAGWDPEKVRDALENTQIHMTSKDLVPTWVQENHDWNRTPDRMGSPDRARAALLFQLGLPGMVTIYQGQELVLPNLPIPGGWDFETQGHYRDGPRALMPWDSSPSAGWPAPPEGRSYWVRHSPGHEAINVQRQLTDPNSPLHMVRKALQLRNTETMLQDFRVLGTGAASTRDVVAVSTGRGRDKQVVAMNMSDLPANFRAPNVMILTLRSDDGVVEIPWGEGDIPSDVTFAMRPARNAAEIRTLLATAQKEGFIDTAYVDSFYNSRFGRYIAPSTGEPAAFSRGLTSPSTTSVPTTSGTLSSL